MDWQQHMRETARHLVDMAHTPGWEDHAKFRRGELVSQPIYAGLWDLIREEQQRRTADAHHHAAVPQP